MPTSAPESNATHAADALVEALLADPRPQRSRLDLDIDAFFSDETERWPVRLCYERAATGAPLRALALAPSRPDLEPPQWREDEGLAECAARTGTALIELQAPLALRAVEIGKPWGRELWFTGMERRGTSAVVDGAGRTTPLPFVLALAPRRFTGSTIDALNLLKILDPHPDPLLGDLYFELHTRKQEVYVVTAVDRDAWPGGEGAIRFGFAPERLQAAADTEAFCAEYAAAVAGYRAVREQIDGLLEHRRAEAGLAPDAPVMPARMRRWLADLPAELKARERSAREAMHAFTALRPLAVGDVVRVPIGMPHALQHGVRVIEFQTPVYERLILSFGQKVLTQPDWDTEAALALWRAQPPTTADAFLRLRDAGAGDALLAAFPDFEVWRERPDAGPLPARPTPRVAVVLEGELIADDRRCGAGSALVLPAGPLSAHAGPGLALVSAWPLHSETAPVGA